LSALEETTRPSRAEIEPAALELIRSHGAQIMATARRYAASPEDAEDAYQRGLEILLTKAPSTSADDLVPWLKTVVKHEAFSLRKQRERHGMPTEHDDTRPALRETHEHVERLDQLQRGAEAMQRLKPAEVRCLLLLAEGHSYAEICAITGFTYTKVNRSLAEGRERFAQRVAGIEAGVECKRFAPLISAAADGEAGSDDMLALRRHMRGCLQCRASLREARQVPARVAALVPAGLVFVPHGGGSAWGWLHERLTSLALRGHQALEATAAHKAAALVASAATLAGGAVVTATVVRHTEPVHAKRSAAVVTPQPKPAATPEPHVPKMLTVAEPAPHRAPEPRRVKPGPQPAPEQPAPAPAPLAQPTTQPPADYGPAPAPQVSAGGSSAGEFAP
jgi:RNA polymerase sigma factor (sigma-70 family)